MWEDKVMSKFESFATVSCPRCALIAYVTCLRVKFMGQTTSAEKYSIFGEDMQVVALNLGADEKVTLQVRMENKGQFPVAVLL